MWTTTRAFVPMVALVLSACFDLGTPNARDGAAPAADAAAPLDDAAPADAIADDARSPTEDAAPGVDAAPDAAPRDADPADAPAPDAPAPDAEPPCVEGPVPTNTPGLLIDIANFDVSVPAASIARGGVVIWRNRDNEMRHQMLSGDPGQTIPPQQGGFDSGELGGGERYAHRFCTPRVLPYYCVTHPRTMRDYSLEIR